MGIEMDIPPYSDESVIDEWIQRNMSAEQIRHVRSYQWLDRIQAIRFVRDSFNLSLRESKEVAEYIIKNRVVKNKRQIAINVEGFSDEEAEIILHEYMRILRANDIPFELN